MNTKKEILQLLKDQRDIFGDELFISKQKLTGRSGPKPKLIAEGLSIVVMEAFEILTQFVIPGVMEAGLSEPVFWYGMIAALAVGFVAAFPVNYVMIKKGVRHKH